jgi:hypothetical protein
MQEKDRLSVPNISKVNRRPRDLKPKRYIELFGQCKIRGRDERFNFNCGEIHCFPLRGLTNMSARVFGSYQTGHRRRKSAIAAMRVYVSLQTRPSFTLTLCGSNLFTGQIDSLTQRFAWLECGTRAAGISTGAPRAGYGPSARHGG